jgi:response regulator of citrate/malate metabolism
VIRTLVVEDDPVAAAAHAQYVGRVRGFEVVAGVATGAEALRVLARGGVDLVLLDVHLPDTSGLEVLRRMRAAGHTTDVIMVTQARDLSVVRAAIAFGATQYLVKPFTSGAVRAKLEGYVAFRDRLAAGRPIAQDDVDGLFDALRAPVGPDALPKTVSRETLDAVVAALRARGSDTGRTATEVGEELGMSRVTARRYLEHLVDAGLATREPRYGGTGRPQLEYRPR